MAEEDEEQIKKKSNALPIWGNQQSMNINNLVVTNILSSPYFKNELFKIKTFHEVIDEIYYKVDHLEPWEKGSRKIRGQVGMCGGVRGVGTGGIVSSTFCLLFKLFTLKLTKKQVYTLLNHVDSPYIRAMGFMFIRYCQHPSNFWEWFEPYLEDDEEIDPKAGGGCTMTIGQMVRSFLLKPDWYGTLFPRIPVPIFKEIEVSLKACNLNDDRKIYADEEEYQPELEEEKINNDDSSFGEAEKYAQQKRDERKYSDMERPKHKSSERERHSSSDKEYRHQSDKEQHSSKDLHDKHRSHGKYNNDDYNKRDSRNSPKSRDRSHDRLRNRSLDRSRKKSHDSSRNRSHDRSRNRSHDRSRNRSHDRSHHQNKSKD